ncbi:MAG: PKD domain-containing protein [Lentimicrobiaceae bacterium]|nr:PKD domain-containing protein [Lentimicrobiaceae bacterium]
MKKVNLLLGVVLGGLLMLPTVVWSQACPNLNFSYGTLAYWQCYTGMSSPYSVAATGAVPGRHTIMDADALQKTGQLYDEICNLLPKVPDGFSYSCKIGNGSVGAEAEGIEYEMRVDSMNSLLMLYFAFVLQRAGHGENDQPKFSMTIKDSLGRPMSTLPCGVVNFRPEFIPFPLLCNSSADAMAWVNTGFSLESLIGQKIYIYFETWDCPPTAHYGYAYVVGECRPMRIDLAYCDGQDVARMKAPDGFESYEWTRSSVPSWRSYSKQINIEKPMDNEVFTVNISNALGCTSQLKTVIQKTSVNTSFMYGVKDADGNVDFAGHGWLNWHDTCTRTATFVDFSSVRNSKKDRITWTIEGLNATSTDSMWTYTFPDPPGTLPVTYQVKLTVIAENGCADTSSGIDKRITIYPSPIVRIAGPNQLCEGKTDVLSATVHRSEFVEHNWTWRKTDGTTGSATGETLPINGPGVYYLNSLDTNGCHAYDTLNVTPLKPVINGLRITDVDCWGNATGEFRHDSITGGSGTFDTAIWTIWDNAGQVLVDSNIISKIGTTVIFRGQIAGKYTFYGVDSEGCPLYDTVVIKEPDSLRLELVPKKTTCKLDNGEIAFFVTGGTIPYNISVTNGPATPSQNGNRTGEYYVNKLPEGIYTAQVIDSNKCVTGGIQVEILAEPEPTLIVDTIISAKCGENNGGIEFRAYYIYEDTTLPAPGPYTCTWTPDKNSKGDPLLTNMIGNLAPGWYELKFLDGNKCPVNMELFVDSFPVPTLTYTVRQETCNRKDGGIVVTVKSKSLDYIEYEWYKLPDTTNILAATDTLTDLLAGTYFVIVRDSFCEVTETIIVPHVDGPVADFTASTYSIPTNTIVTLTADTARRGTGTTHHMWDWDMGDGNSMAGRVVRYSYEEVGDYLVRMVVTDINGCTDDTSKMIHVYDELHVYIPNSFSPNNGDKLNDTWKPIVLEHSKEGYMLSVYDRWGQRVFHTTDPDESWDGKIDGKPAQGNTVYSYRLTVRDFTGQEFEYIGHVSILR